MRHPWILSTAATAAVLILTSAAPQSAGADPDAADSWALASVPDGGRRPDICLEGFARGAAHLAYLQAILQLTAAQQPLWDKWEKAMRADAALGRSICESGRAARGQPPSALDRDADLARAASAHLDAQKAARPDLEALYGALNPAQRAVFDRLWPPVRPLGPGPEHAGGVGMESPAWRPGGPLPVMFPPILPPEP
jgi:hypothetical protein